MNATRRVPLAEIVDMVGGGTPSKSVPEFFTGQIPWVTPKDMKRWEILSAQVHITEQAIRSSATRIVPANSILVVVRSGVLKHSLPVAISRVAVAINQDMKALICKDEVSPDYLARYLQFAAPIVLQWVRATTADNIPSDKLKLLEVPLPPLPEQRRVAAILDQADALRAKRQEVSSTLTTLKQAIFVDMFGTPTGNGKGLPTVALRELTEIATGTTPSRREPENFKGSIPWVKTTEINGGVIRETEEQISEMASKKHRCRIHPRGSIVVALYGQGTTRGRSAILGIDAATNQACGVLLPSKRFDPVFMLCQLSLCYGDLRSLARGGNQENLNLSLLGGFKVLCPTLADQKRFVSRAAKCQEMTAAAETSTARLEALLYSLQRALFIGES